MAANLAFRVNDYIKSLLDQLTKEEGITKTSVVNQALSDYFQKRYETNKHTNNTPKQGDAIQEQDEAIQEDKAVKQTIDNIGAETDSPELSGVTDTDTKQTKQTKQIEKLAMLGGAVWLICRKYNFNQ